MILPNNGKVVIIDDEPKDVKELMFALTKEKMPFLLFQDAGGDDLPAADSPIENVRLVFLDLDLGLGGLGDVEMIRVVQGRMVRVINKNNPYVLVIWSNHEDKLSKLLIDEFENGFKDYKPIAYCSLDKTVLKKPDPKEIVEIIRHELKKCLSSFESFNAFLFWESIVNKSSGEIFNGFTKIFDFNEKWDNNIKAFFYRLAKANVGETKANLLSDEKKLQLALETINSALIDSVEKNIKSAGDILQLNIAEAGADITPKNLIEINTTLHLLSSNHLEHFEPGNVYFQPVCDEAMILQVVQNTFNKKYVDEILNSSPQTIKLDITPVCDYSQDKGYTRFLSGVLINGKYKTAEFKKNVTPIYIYDLCPVINIAGDSYYLVFDFRYFKSLKQEYVAEHFHKPTYKIRSQLLTDLQACLSNHINRPGIVSVI